MSTLRNILLATLAMVALFSCQRTKKDIDTLTSGVIRIAVDETLMPIINDEIAAFENKFPNAGIVPIDTSEVGAINLLLQNDVYLAIAARTLSEKEENYLKSKKFQPRSHLLAVDGIALIVNPANPDTLITVGQLRKILLGEITRWEQIYPNSKLGEISLVFDNPNSSTIRYMIESICKGEKLSEQNLYAQKNNRQVLEYVANNRTSIGVIGVSWLSDRSDSTGLSFDKTVRLMSVSNETVATPDNSYKPYQYYLHYDYYPLARKIFIIHNDPRSGLATGFTRFLTGDIGQRIILRSGLVPATQNIRVVRISDN